MPCVAGGTSVSSELSVARDPGGAPSNRAGSMGVGSSRLPVFLTRRGSTLPMLVAPRPLAGSSGFVF